MIEFEQFVQWTFYGLLSGVAIYAAKTLGKLRESVEFLNVQIAVILTKSDGYEKTLAKHGDEIEKLKTKHGG